MSETETGSGVHPSAQGTGLDQYGDLPFFSPVGQVLVPFSWRGELVDLF